MNESTSCLPAGAPDRVRWPGLVWGFDIVDGHARPVSDAPPPERGLRWLHVSLADQRAHRWIAAMADLPSLVRDLLLSPDEHVRALVDDSGAIACVIQDGGRDFMGSDEDRVQALRFALAPGLMLTARTHPVRCADVVRQRIETHVAPSSAAAAFDLLFSAIVIETSERLNRLVLDAHDMEDALIDHGREPEPRALQLLRRRSVRIHRHVGGLHGVLRRLEEDETLPSMLLPPIERLVQRVAGMEGDGMALISQERLLRDELDMRATQRTNRNLYVLSVMTAVMLPPTLVAGLFGMNTGGLPLASEDHGTLIACLMALGSTGVTYLLLRLSGFLRGGWS